ncbi:NPS16 [Fusarium pseudograminearum CS3096]|uniref:NPS16 n=1 Tax=Fusarium pseudograminearum (strain CS3096) TaxID=1028729 RepID=K3V921_FUSPC|nr:NPS16 [Fusarium pseudograminearum CS3096]EKJ68473.1 NPS16 [Fusarium pseudograminearum CS3096]
MSDSSRPDSIHDFDMETASGILPTRAQHHDEKPSSGAIVLSQQSVSPTEMIVMPFAKQEDHLLRSWAIALHLYLVSDQVAFLASGLKAEPHDQVLIYSHWPLSVPSVSFDSNAQPELTVRPFEAKKHSHLINSSVRFTEQDRHVIDNIDGTVQYHVQVTTHPTNRNISLYTGKTRVPSQFASVLWKTFQEIHLDLLSPSPRDWRRGLASNIDKSLLQSFLPRTPAKIQSSVIDLWRESVRTAPRAPAVDAWDGTLTYNELDDAAEKLTLQLLSKGVRTGDFVPFSFEKSVWMVVAVLAILKAGAAFVAVDPSQPEPRAKEIISQINARLIVTSPSQSKRFTQMGLNVLQVSQSTTEEDDNTHQFRQLPRVLPNDPAVCIFTSGSTGKPKGIVVQHQALTTRMLAEGGALGYRGARALQFAASTWDIFITDIFATLLHQGCVCIPSEQDRLFNLAEFCTSHNVTLAIVTPSLANTLSPASFPTLKTLIFSGEALRKDVVARWSSQSGLALYQGYGPAETGGCIIGPLANRAEVIGHAVKEYICVLVDPKNQNRLVPVGAVGELLVAGPGLLQEYIKDPARTDAVVVQNPPWLSELGVGETRFYKTGDLLRYNIDTLDGSLEFVGRTDGQVKYHGQRIELGEVEYNLGLFPDVSHSMANLVKEGPWSGQLVAVVQVGTSTHHGTSIDSIEHRDSVDIQEKITEFLTSRLPRYMIPSKILVVKGLPLNASMKLDRAAIQKWIISHSTKQTTVPNLLPATSGPKQLLPTERTARKVSEMYIEIVAGKDQRLRKQLEGVDFNIQSGGIDSVQIMSFSEAIKQRFAVQIPMDQMLSSRSTIRTLAATVDAVQDLKGAKNHDISASTNDDIDSLLESVLHPRTKQLRNSAIRHVFVTGASGYVGTEIVRQLLTQSDCQIHALVRASSDQAGQDYLLQKFIDAAWWKGEYESRIHAWLGDLSQPQLGLDTNAWGRLEGKVPDSIDCIIHNGAKVHYHMDYETLKATNVTSTVQILQAINNRADPLQSFVYVSGGQPLSFDSEDDVSILQKALQGSGYARSKAMSEMLVRRFAEQAEEKVKYIQIIKPGYIMGDAKRGMANKGDFIWRYIAASLELGAYDQDTANGWLFLSDVGRVSEVVSKAAFEPSETISVTVQDGIQFQDIWQLLQEEYGFALRPLRRDEWLQQLRQSVAAKQEQHVMFPLMYMLETTDHQPFGVSNGPDQPSKGVKEALRANINNLMDQGFFVAPGSDSCPTTAQDALDVQSVRRQFPALHGGLVAFNNAAGTAVYQGAIDNTHKYMSAFPVELGLDDPQSQAKTKRMMDKVAELAAFMNADADEIAFGQSTTMILRTLGQALKPSLNSDCEMIVSSLCHEGSAGAWRALAADLGIAIKWWMPPAGDDPCLSLETLKPLLSPKTRIVACNHVSNVVGTIHPIKQIADAVHAIPGAIVIVDGVAWAPHRPIDVKALDVDFYCFSWYKVFGPHMAQLYGRRSVQQRMVTGIAHFFLSGMPGLDWRLRLGSNAFELEEALVPITRYLTDIGWDKIIAQETVLQEVLLSYLNRHPTVFRVFGEKTSDPEKRVAVITFQVIGQSSRDVMNKVNRQGKFRIVAGHCWAPRPTHDVLKLEDDGLIRISFVHYNTVEEVREFCDVLERIVNP